MPDVAVITRAGGGVGTATMRPFTGAGHDAAGIPPGGRTRTTVRRLRGGRGP
ncbi:hypothetical protein [Streptomyces sp. GC420]|uniref:hypothetical protein n=1 Tax=Streptomyces sp. GC420 TaxID=2697568 RepID=UPI001414D79D|nr:hypothetical protein [Streptomyces sp. GC420]NBM18955.1 hypothetical protein [Streptomyces sp. GC420]